METKRTPERRLAGIRELMEYTGLGRNSAMRLGAETGARVKIGARVLYDLRKIDAYIDAHAGEEEKTWIK